MPGYARSKRRFVLVRTGELLEGERDRADIALASVAHQPEQTAGIDTRRQENPDLDIGQQMRPHTVGDANTHAFSKFRGRRGLARSIGKDRGQASEGLGLARTRGVDPLAGCRTDGNRPGPRARGHARPRHLREAP